MRLVFDYSDGDICFDMGSNMLIDSNGGLMQKIGCGMAIDMNSGEMHIIDNIDCYCNSFYDDGEIGKDKLSC